MAKVYSIPAEEGKHSKVQIIKTRVLRRLRKIPFRDLTPKQIHWLVQNDPVERPLFVR